MRSRAYDEGGVIYLKQSIASINLSHFTSSLSGKNLAVVNGSVKIESCSFNNNSGTNAGVLYASTKSKLTITCSVFINNVAASTGGVLHQEERSNCAVFNCLFF